MTNTLVNELRAWLLRPTVVHRLPGRVRLRIAALKRLDPQQQKLSLLWRDILRTPPQIEAVEANLTTGSVLIQYDAAAITETEVLVFLGNVNRFVLRHWDRLAATTPQHLPTVVRRLQREARRALRQRPALDADTKVPDSVWA